MTTPAFDIAPLEQPEEPDDGLDVKKAGEGVVKAKNPFENLMLPEISEDEFNKIETKTGAPAGSGKGASKLIDYAKKFIGTPYKWAGTSPLGFDCSGFTQYVYRQMGINLPRISYQQAQYGERVSMKEARPGDLVAWDVNDRNVGADHIAIYLGDGYVIHAPKPGDSVKISRVWGNPWAVRMNL